jgi:thiol-disulfide isomerase/thioredoxin
MNTRRRRSSANRPALPLFIAIVIAINIGPQRAEAQDQIGIAVGATPEAITLEDLDGNSVSLADYIGKKPVLLEFWATWCPLCKALEPRMEAAFAKYGDDVEFLIVAVAVNQTRRRVGRHAAEHEMPGRILWDGEGAAVRAFMAPSTSYVVVLDADGTVAYTGLGDDQDIDAAIAKALGR